MGPRPSAFRVFARPTACSWPKGTRGSVATFPPPHTFFFTREVDVNLGYVFYRNDGSGTYSIGVTMPEAESDTFPQYEQNYALYNAPPGTWQKMSMFFYASPEPGEATRQAALAFTRDDVFKAVPGYKTFVNHFHLRVVDRMRVGGFDTPLQDLIAMKAIGLNVIGLSDFHADSLAANDYGPARFRDQKDYAEVSRRLSDKDFLVVPWEEPSVAFGGHYNVMWPKNVFWSKPNRTGGGGRGWRAGRSGGPSGVHNAAVHGERSDLRQGLPHGQRRGTCSNSSTPKAGTGITRTRARSPRPASRTPPGARVSEKRSVSWRRLQAGHGPGQLRGDDVRVALL